MNQSVNISLFERKNDLFAGAVYTGDFYVAFAASSTSDFCHCQVASSFKHVGNLMMRQNLAQVAHRLKV